MTELCSFLVIFDESSLSRSPTEKPIVVLDFDSIHRYLGHLPK